MIIRFQKNEGPIAQLAEPPAHNRKVPGSIPGGPTRQTVWMSNKTNKLKGRGVLDDIRVHLPWCTFFGPWQVMR